MLTIISIQNRFIYVLIYLQIQIWHTRHNNNLLDDYLNSNSIKTKYNIISLKLMQIIGSYIYFFMVKSNFIIKYKSYYSTNGLCEDR